MEHLAQSRSFFDDDVSDKISDNSPKCFLGDDFFQDLLMSIMNFDKNISFCIFKAMATPVVFSSSRGSAATCLIHVAVAVLPLLYTSNSASDCGATIQVTAAQLCRHIRRYCSVCLVSLPRPIKISLYYVYCSYKIYVEIACFVPSVIK